MLSIQQSENLPDLAKLFAKQVLTRQDPFRTPLVLVPNVMIRTWLSYHLSQQGARAEERVAINLDFRFLDAGLWDILAAMDPAANAGAGKKPVRRLKREYRQWLIIQELHRALLAAADPDGALAPLLGYLRFAQGDPEERAAGQSKRLWQLADGLARLFLEYESNRPDVVRKWAEGGGPEGVHAKAQRPQREDSEDLFSASLREANPMLEAQRALYTALFGLDGLCARTNPTYLSLPQYFWTLFREPGKLSALRKWSEVHVFTLPQLSQFHVQILRELGKLLRLNVYDLASAGTSSGVMAQWGKAQRSKQSLLSKIGESTAGVHAEAQRPQSEDSKELFSACSASLREANPIPTVLSRVQAHLQGHGPVRAKRKQDASIQIGACPSLRREVETVYSSIVEHMLAANKAPAMNPRSEIRNPKCSLTLTDFTILVPDMNLYKPVIEAVFGRVADSAAALDADSRDAAYERPLLTYNLLDSNAADDSVYAQAVEALLALGDEGFTRKELFHLIQNPCFLARHGLGREDVEVWLNWAAALNIYRDASSPHHTEPRDTGAHAEAQRPQREESEELFSACSASLREKDAGPESRSPTPDPRTPDESGEVFAWRHGLRCLRLGRIMLPPRDSLNDRDAFRGLVPYADMESQSAEQVGKFCTLVFELIRSARELRGSAHTCGEWHVLLQRQLERFLEIPSERREEQVVRTALFRALQDLGELDTHIHAAQLSGLSPERRGERAFGFALAREMVRGSMVAMPTHTGHLLLDGVTVAALRPGRMVPFKYVYVLGLGAGNFPGEESISALDLRQNALRAEDDLSAMDAGREAMREAILSAGERVYLTYVARDLQKDEQFQPCAIVNELCTYLESEVLLPRTIPSPAGSGSFTPIEEAKIPLKGSSRSYLASSLSPIPQGERETGLLCRPCFRHDRFLASPPEDLQRRISARFAVSSLLPPEGGGGKELRRLTLRELADFLTDPAKAVLKHRLRLREEEEDDRALAEAEPTRTGFPLDYGLYAAAQQYCLALLAAQSQTAQPGAPEHVREETLAFLERYYGREARRGRTPAAPFKLLDKRRYAEELEEFLESDALQALREQRGRALYVAFGTLGAGSGCATDTLSPLSRPLLLPPLALPGQDGEQLVVHGNCLLVWDRQDGLCEIATVAGSASRPARDTPSKHMLEPVLFYLALRACKARLSFPAPLGGEGRAGGGGNGDLPRLAGEAGSRIVVLYKNGIGTWTVPAWRAEEAGEYLRNLACEFLYASRVEFLPFEEAIKWPELREGTASVPPASVRAGETPAVRAPQEGLAESLSIAVERNLDSGYSHSSDLLRLIPLVVPADPLAVARRRLKPLLDGFAAQAEAKAGPKTAKKTEAGGTPAVRKDAAR